jgi:hypothetical protein
MEKILSLGNLFYLKKYDEIKDETYEPVSKEYWMILRDLEPSKFGLTYSDYINLKREQHEQEIKNRKKSNLELVTYMYSLSPILLEETKKTIKEIQSNELFERWVTDNEIIEYILNYEHDKH